MGVILRNFACATITLQLSTSKQITDVTLPTNFPGLSASFGQALVATIESP